MLRTWIHRIKPGKEARLRDWFVELNSQLAIDAEHRRVMEECIADALNDTPLYDMYA